MKLNLLPNLNTYVSQKLGRTADPSERIRLQNLLLEERVPDAGHILYHQYFSACPVSDFADWNNRHRNFVDTEIALEADSGNEPWTFRPENAANLLPLVERRLYLIRVEDARRPCELNGVSFEQVQQHISQLHTGQANEATERFLSRFSDTWNAANDLRPLFATTAIEIDDLLDEDSPQLAEALRNRLGLGHYSPAPETPPIPVFIMRYTLDEIYQAHGGQGQPAVPTLLDGTLNDCFFPSPHPGPQADANPCLGHALNLSPTSDENSYKLGVELLHRHLPYHPHHFYRCGLIANPYTMPLERARSFHLPWLRLYRDREDFGQGILT